MSETVNDTMLSDVASMSFDERRHFLEKNLTSLRPAIEQFIDAAWTVSGAKDSGTKKNAFVAAHRDAFSPSSLCKLLSARFHKDANQQGIPEDELPVAAYQIEAGHAFLDKVPITLDSPFEIYDNWLAKTLPNRSLSRLAEVAFVRACEEGCDQTRKHSPSTAFRWFYEYFVVRLLKILRRKYKGIVNDDDLDTAVSTAVFEFYQSFMLGNDGIWQNRKRWAGRKFLINLLIKRAIQRFPLLFHVLRQEDLAAFVKVSRSENVIQQLKSLLEVTYRKRTDFETDLERLGCALNRSEITQLWISLSRTTEKGLPRPIIYRVLRNEDLTVAGEKLGEDVSRKISCLIDVTYNHRAKNSFNHDIKKLGAVLETECMEALWQTMRRTTQQGKPRPFRTATELDALIEPLVENKIPPAGIFNRLRECDEELRVLSDSFRQCISTEEPESCELCAASSPACLFTAKCGVRVLTQPQQARISEYFYRNEGATPHDQLVAQRAREHDQREEATRKLRRCFVARLGMDLQLAAVTAIHRDVDALPTSGLLGIVFSDTVVSGLCVSDDQRIRNLAFLYHYCAYTDDQLLKRQINHYGFEAVNPRTNRPMTSVAGKLPELQNDLKVHWLQIRDSVMAAMREQVQLKEDFSNADV